MIRYEVNLEIDNSISQQFSDWIPGHIQEVLGFNGFQKAHIFEDSNTPLKLSIVYEVDSMENLQNYFEHHAATMREKTLVMFGDNVKASRRVLKLTKLLYHTPMALP